MPSPMHHKMICRSSTMRTTTTTTAPSHLHCTTYLMDLSPQSKRQQGIRQRRHNKMLLALSSHGDNNINEDDSNNESNINMPSDDALFREFSSTSGDDNSDDEVTLSDSTIIFGNNYDDDDGDDDDDDSDPYAQMAPSEFAEEDNDTILLSPAAPNSLEKAVARQLRQLNTSPLDWGGALSTLRSRVSDIESGRSTNPPTALFRTITRERPNEAIGRFVREANPEVVAAMTGMVSSLLGSLSNPAMGMEVIVQASSEKLGNLCFQLMMTGYMFRNAEYVLALKSLMNIRGEGATLEEYREAFQRLDTNGSGYLERGEIEALLTDVYQGKPPAFEINTFVEFFDSNNDGRVSWEEFERGFGVVTKMGGNNDVNTQMNRFSLPGSVMNADDDDEDDDLFGEPAISGTIQVELEDGKIIEVDAQEYVNDLKQQALELKMELAVEQGIDPKVLGIPADAVDGKQEAAPRPGGSSGIASYIASLQGDVKSLTQGISPDVVDSMKLLIDFVLEGGPEGGGGGVGGGRSSAKKAMDKKKEMELPGSALQQLALWQLVIGYRLRETEATGEWRKMLE
jgi:hypothetical protein